MEALITCLTNWKTTILGFVAGIALYVVANGVKLPSSAQEWWTFAFAALVAGLGFVAKDATTGSRPLILVPFLALALTGCATVSPQVLAVEKFTTDDLQAALTDATAHNDQAGVTCWSTLLGIVQAAGNQSPPRILGAASALQAKRDLLGQGGQNQLADMKRRLNLGCAALMVDESATLLKFGGPLLGIPALP